MKLEPLYAAKAKENQRGGQGGVLLCQNSDKANPMDTKKQLAKVAGTSHDTIAKVEWRATLMKRGPYKLSARERLPYAEPARECKRIEDKILLRMDRGYRRVGNDRAARKRNFSAANERSAFRVYEGRKALIDGIKRSRERL